MEICPVGKIKCSKYEYFDDEVVFKEAHPSNHRCRAFGEQIYIHNFEVCPFPSQQEEEE